MILSSEKITTFSSSNNIATFSKMLQYYRESMVNVVEPAESGVLKSIFGFFSLVLQTDFGV
jgi:hypothetical protein